MAVADSPAGFFAACRDVHLRRQWAARAARRNPDLLADLDDLVADIMVDAYGDDEPQVAFLVAAFGWLLDPTAELLPLMEAGALRLLAAEIDLRDRAADWCRLAWTVPVRLRKVAALRDIAMAGCPDGDTHAGAEIGDSLAAAWQWAAEPYAPLRGIPAIAWTPGGGERATPSGPAVAGCLISRQPSHG